MPNLLSQLRLFAGFCQCFELKCSNTYTLTITDATKIVVISDGKMTPIHIQTGQDLPDIDNN